MGRDDEPFLAIGIAEEYVDNGNLPNPDIYQFYKDLQDRVLYIDDDIENYTIEFAKIINRWNREDRGKQIEARKPITIFFNSDGGLTDVGISIISVIENSKTPVIGVCLAKAYSAACFMFLACHRRYCFDGSWFLVHRGSGGTYGNQLDAEAQNDQWKRMTEWLKNFTLGKIKVSEKSFDEHWKSDWFFNAEEAVKIGAVNAVVHSLDEIK